MGKIKSIVYKPEGIESRPADQYARVAVETAELVVGHGIKGDRKGGHPTRQINLMDAAQLVALAEAGYDIAPGQLGEQIVVEGLAIDDLPEGTQLQIGAAVIEITTRRTGCDRLEHIQGKTAPEVGTLGMLARVVSAGPIRLGDAVRVVGA